MGNANVSDKARNATQAIVSSSTIQSSGNARTLPANATGDLGMPERITTPDLEVSLESLQSLQGMRRVRHK